MEGELEVNVSEAQRSLISSIQWNLMSYDLYSTTYAKQCNDQNVDNAIGYMSVLAQDLVVYRVGN